ncbi:MAG: EamA family transporter RarD [Rhodospirillaceae bacterium]|nr:EamA family transporter RarD [Rhodospirillaceae bacterium]
MQRSGTATTAASSETRLGLACTLAAFLLWGFNPFYFKAVADVPALEVLAHRVVWSFAMLLPVYLVTSRPWPFRTAFGNRRILTMLLASTTIMAANWLVYIWSVVSDQLLQASLGYYITPLVNVAIGILILRERLRPVQAIAVALAVASVVLQAIGLGAVPWIGLGIAITFGTYGLLRKQMGIGALDGLFIEALLMLPAALGFLLWLEIVGSGAFGRGGLALDLLLMAAGPVTAFPLFLFVTGARRISMIALGFCQYLTPSIYFLLSLFWYDEPFGIWQLASFAIIWVAIAIFTVDTLRGYRRRAAELR